MSEIFTDKFGGFPWRFRFQPESTNSDRLATITEPVKRGDFSVTVADAGALEVGMTIDIFHRSLKTLELNMPNLVYKDVWRIKNNGIRPFEKHIISEIDGNSVTFKNPVQLNIPADEADTPINNHTVIEEVGVEDILFTSAWKDHPDVFVHHASDLVDYAWRAVIMENVKNGWIKNCEFKDWNEAIQIEKSIGITVKDVVISGKRAHTSYYTRYSYGILFDNCKDEANMQHGPGLRWSTTNTVYRNCKMSKGQSIDCHGFHPYANLLDNVYGGTMDRNGGAENSYPNSGPDLTFWNFKHDSDANSRVFDFWDPVNRKLHTFPYPKFIGFQEAEGQNITLRNAGLDEMKGTQVYPSSLFEAQLQLRLFNAYASSSATSADALEPRHVIDGDANTYWQPEGSGEGSDLTVDLGLTYEVEQLSINELSNTVASFELSYWNGSQWATLTSGTSISNDKVVEFPTIETSRIKLSIQSVQGSEPVQISAFTIAKGDVVEEPEIILAIDGNHDDLHNVISPNPSSDGVFRIKHSTDWKVYAPFGGLIAEGSGNIIDLGASQKGLYFIHTPKGIFKVFIR